MFTWKPVEDHESILEGCSWNDFELHINDAGLLKNIPGQVFGEIGYKPLRVKIFQTHITTQKESVREILEKEVRYFQNNIEKYNSGLIRS
jgi:hypothetical protein